ncbi:MAG: T9SS type A sorting domain-containing protein, partial [Dysgonamonadaceae bacterium]|nr:T9SS type A sorting domain-containing protein [Dysgonamonadaceae bacterium]
GNLNITKAGLIVTAENKSREYGEVNPNLTYSISGFKNNETQSVINNLPSVSTLATQTSNVGNYAITASGASDNNYDFSYQNGNLSITKAALTVTAGNKTREYGEANPNLTYSISGFKNSETQSVIDKLPSVSTSATQTSNVGNYPITVSGASDNNYDFSYQNGNLTIEKASLTVTAQSKSRTYGEANPNLTYLIFGFKNNETQSVIDVSPNIATDATQTSNVGTYAITVSGASDNNYDFSYQNGRLIITKAPLTVTAENKSRTYGEANPNLTYSISGFKNSETQSVIDKLPSVSTSSTQTSNVGTYAITVSGASDNNYDFSYQNGNLSITKASLTVTAQSKSRKYGEANPNLTYSISGFKNNETQSVIDKLPSVSTSATQASNVGTYLITASGASDNNYDFIYQNGTLTIDKAPQTITFVSDIFIKKYGDAPFTIAQTSSGLPLNIVSSDPSKLAVANNMAHIVGTGTFALTASQSGNINYLPAPDAVTTVTVSKAPLTITANDVVRNFGEANPQFTMSYSGFKNGEHEGMLDLLPTASCPANENSPVGDYVIMLSGGSDKNYIYTLVNGKLTVEDATKIKNEISGRLEIFPVPAKDELFIKSDLPIQKVEIYTLSGFLLMSEDNFNEKISVSSLLKGVYLLKVYRGWGVTVSKIMKE